MVDMMLAYRKLVMNIYHLLVLLTPMIVPIGFVICTMGSGREDGSLVSVAIVGFLVGCGSAGFLLTINEIVGNLEAISKQS